jgi:hypothetical protein
MEIPSDLKGLARLEYIARNANELQAEAARKVLARKVLARRCERLELMEQGFSPELAHRIQMSREFPRFT